MILDVVPVVVFANQQMYFCKNCFNDLIAKAKDQPEKIPIRCWWIKPQYVSVAKAIMRHRRKHH